MHQNRVRGSGAEIPAEFNGKIVHIIFRHYDSTDMYWLNLDDVSVFSSTSPEPEPEEPDPGLTFYRAPARDLPGLNARKIVR